MIGRPNHRSRGDLLKSHGLPQLPEFIEDCRVNVPPHRQMVETGLKVLPEGEHAYAVFPEISHRIPDLVVRLSQTEHES